MAGRVNEEQNTVHARVRNVTFAHSRELFAEVDAVLVLDVLDNRFPAGSAMRNAYYIPVLVVHKVAVAGRVNKVQAQLDAILDNDCVLACARVYTHRAGSH